MVNQTRLMPSRVAWIYELRKTEILALFAKFNIRPEGTLDDLRKMIRKMVQGNPELQDPRIVISTPEDTDQRPQPDPRLAADTMEQTRKWGCLSWNE